MNCLCNDYLLHIGADRFTHTIITTQMERKSLYHGMVCWLHRERETKKITCKRNKIIDQHLSSVLCTSRCQSSAPVRSPHPAGCGCVSVADADLVLGHQSPSLPARPSWRHEKLHLLGATQPKIFFYYWCMSQMLHYTLGTYTVLCTCTLLSRVIIFIRWLCHTVAKYILIIVWSKPVL